MKLIVGIGIIVSVGLLTGLSSAGGGAGFIVWVVIMLILWGAIPTIATKYYNSDEYTSVPAPDFTLASDAFVHYSTESDRKKWISRSVRKSHTFLVFQLKMS